MRTCKLYNRHGESKEWYIKKVQQIRKLEGQLEKLVKEYEKAKKILKEIKEQKEREESEEEVSEDEMSE